MSMQLSKAIEGYFLDRRVALAPATIQNYKHALAKLQDHMDGDPQLETITPRDITAMLETLATQPQPCTGIANRPAKPLSKTTILNIHSVCSSFWRWAVREELVGENIIDRVERPQPETRAIIPYSEDDVRAMLGACRHARSYTRPGKSECANTRPTADRDRAILLLLLDTGIRASELCNACVRDLDQHNARLKVRGKRSKERILRLGNRTNKAIWRYLSSRADLRPEDPLFVTDGTATRPLDRHNLHRLIRRIGDRAGVSPAAHPHRFRHTFAITFLRNGGDVFSLKSLLGHSTLKMVEHYLAIAQADTEAAHRRASPVDNWRL